MAYRTLVAVGELAQHLNVADWRIVDCRFDLAQPERGESAFRAGHLPGAVYAHLDRDLSGARTAQDGRHPLPEPKRLAERLGAWGIGPGVQVVAYDDSQGLFASRLWWLTRAIGHADVAVLDGGLPAWRAAGLPLSTAEARWPARPFDGRGAFPGTVSAAELQAALHRRAVCLLDARSAERFEGKVEPLDPVAGHVPGARNLPMAQTLAADGRLLGPAELSARFTAVSGDFAPAATVCMCGSGVTACHTLLALEVAGRPGARLYAGSWSEWCRDPARPVARGPN